VGLGAVLDDLKVVAIADLAERVVVGGEPIEVNRHDGSGTVGDALLDFCGVDVVCVGSTSTNTGIAFA